MYVVEDAHWIDEASESIIADFLSDSPRNALARADHLSARIPRQAGRTRAVRTIALAPLDDSQSTALISELLGAIRRWRRSARTLPSVRPAIRSSPRRWCAIWRNGRSPRPARRVTSRRGTLPSHDVPATLAGDHRRTHRPTRRRGQTHAERGRGRSAHGSAEEQLASLVDPVRIAELLDAETDRRAAVDARARVLLSAPADPVGGL